MTNREPTQQEFSDVDRVRHAMVDRILNQAPELDTGGDEVPPLWDGALALVGIDLIATSLLRMHLASYLSTEDLAAKVSGLPMVVASVLMRIAAESLGPRH